MPRLTNDVSKKIDNFKAAIALRFAYYNHCKIHGAIRCTLGQAAGSSKALGLSRNLLNTVGNNEYFESLQMVIRQMLGAESNCFEPVPVWGKFRFQFVWERVVEVFDVQNHPNAKRCYAGSAGEGIKESFTAVLESPHALSPKTAVRVAAVSEIRKARKA